MCCRISCWCVNLLQYTGIYWALIYADLRFHHPILQACISKKQKINMFKRKQCLDSGITFLYSTRWDLRSNLSLASSLFHTLWSLVTSSVWCCLWLWSSKEDAKPFVPWLKMLCLKMTAIKRISNDIKGVWCNLQITENDCSLVSASWITGTNLHCHMFSRHL